MKHNNKPLVSIVIPCYNHELYVQDCIKSVIAQTYDNIELIIIDDGSTDGSIRKIEELTKICEQRFFRFEFRARSNKGLSNTLNEALEWCSGKYLSCIASDDMLLKEKTSIQVNYLENNDNIIGVFGGVYIINEQNSRILSIKGSNRTYDFEDIILSRAMLYAPTQMIRINLIREVGGYNPDVLIEDWYLWLKLAEKGKLYCMKQCLSQYRDHPNNTSKKFEMMHDARLQVLSLFKHLNLYDRAIKEIQWNYHLGLFLHTNKNKPYHLFYVIKNKPIKTIKLTVGKIIKKLKTI